MREDGALHNGSYTTNAAEVNKEKVGRVIIKLFRVVAQKITVRHEAFLVPSPDGNYEADFDLAI